LVEPPTTPPTPPDVPALATSVGGGDRGPGGRRAALPWLRAALVIVIVIVLDQLTTHAVERSIVPGEEKKFLPGIELVNTRNHGVAFGFLPGNHVAVTILISLALLALLVYFALHARQRLMWLPTGMLIGGALGNILDRVRHGSVTDFIKLPLGWPPFNLADTSITVGIVILFLLVDRARHAERAAQER
jgi:signal peptidase II